MTSEPKRRTGRRDKQASRKAAPANPCPPGQRGGQYAPLTVSEIKRIYDTALGEGHFLSEAQTYAAMERDYH